MIFQLFEVKKGAGLLAKIGSDRPRDAFQILMDFLAAFYAKRGAILEQKTYERPDKRRNNELTWFLAVVYQGREYGKVKMIYLGDAPRFQECQHRTEQQLLVYFEFQTPEISLKEVGRFKRFMGILPA